MRDMKRGHTKEDEFQSIMQRVIKFIVKHQETSIWVGIGAVAVIVLVIILSSRGERTNPEADLMHTQAIGMVSMGRFQEAENVFVELTEKHGNTRAGHIGLYYLGVINYYTGRFNEALEYLDRFLRVEKNDYLLTPSALYGAGCASEGIKDYEKAKGYYARLLKDKEGAFYHQGLLAFGRTLGILGDTEQARKTLEELVAANPPGDLANDAKFYLGYFNR